jgi:PAS domain S-box-containing protein
VAEKPISPDPGKGLRMSEKDLHEIVNQNEKQYRNILDSIEDGYYEVDIAGKLTFFNDSLCKIYGYARDELMGMSNREYMTPETAQKAYELFNRVYKTGEPAKIFDWEFIKKDGIKIDVEISVSLIKNSIGEAIGFRGIVRDISERKRMEAALKKARNELEHRVEERTKELLKINKQLEKEINERKKAEASLKESEENYRILFDNAPDLIIVINIKGNFLDLNNKFEQESGYSREEIIG